MPMRRPWAGMIARLNTETVDGRIVQAMRWSLTVPIFVEADREADPHGSPRLIGAATWIGSYNNSVYASGWVTVNPGGDGACIDPGKHPCGVDLLDVDVNDVEIDDDTQGVETNKPWIVIKGGRIAAVTLYRHNNSPAWPDCRIEVFEQ